MQTPARESSIRIAIRSDRRLFRDSLAACLDGEPNLAVVGHVADPEDLVTLCALGHPEVILFDLGADACESVGALRTVTQRCPSIHTIVMYDRLSPGQLADVRQTGVDTIVPASHSLDALLMVLRQYAERAMASAPDPLPTEALTEGEREIITLVRAGHTTSRIAVLLQLSPNAVENAKRRIYHKLDVGCQSQAIARVAALGMMDLLRDPVPPTRVPDGALLAVMRGPDAPVRRSVATALIAGRVGFTLESARNRSGDRWDHWQRGPVVIILVDPDPADWPGADEPHLPMILVHSGPLRRGATADALARGVTAVIPADRVGQDLVPILAMVLHGYLTLDPGAARTMLGIARAGSADAEAGLPDLTAREGDILRSIAAGHTVRQTARTLGIAEKTVENTQARLFRKLGARNRAGALATAHALGLLDLVEDPLPEALPIPVSIPIPVGIEPIGTSG